MPISNQNFAVGRRLPNKTSQGAFLVTCCFSLLHQRDWNVWQLPSSASSLAAPDHLQRKSHQSILFLFTPAFLLMASNNFI